MLTNFQPKTIENIFRLYSVNVKSGNLLIEKLTFILLLFCFYYYSLVWRLRFTSAQLFLVIRSEYTLCTCSCTVGKKQVPFSMATRNVELIHEWSPKHSRMETARKKQDKETDEEGKKRGVSMERRKAGTKENISPDSPNYPNQNIIIIINIIC